MLYRDKLEETNKSLQLVAKQRWQESSETCTEWLSKTINAAPNHDAGMIIGIGASNDFNLLEVVQQFKKLYCVDIDRNSVELAISSLPVELQARVIPNVEDITGIGQYVSDVIAYLEDQDASYEQAIMKVKALNNRLSDSFKFKSPEACSWIFSDCISTQMLGPLFQKISNYYGANLDIKDNKLYVTFIELNLNLFKHYVKLLPKLLITKGILAFASDVIELNDELIPRLEVTARRNIQEIARDPRLITGLTNFFPDKTIAGWYIDSILEKNPSIKLRLLPSNKKSWLWDFNDDKKYLVIGKQLIKR